MRRQKILAALLVIAGFVLVGFVLIGIVWPEYSAYRIVTEYGFDPADYVEGFIPLAQSLDEPQGAPTVLIPTPLPTSVPLDLKDPPKTGNETSQPIPSATAVPVGPPTRIVIPVIDLDAPVVETTEKKVKLDGKWFEQWYAPDEPAGGWHNSSAKLGEIGNTVINGHHNVYGKVFERLVELQVGDPMTLYSGEIPHTYVVSNILLLPEKWVDMKTRTQNGLWIQSSSDERITLVTCWPANSNSHRLIVVAQPYQFPTSATTIPHLGEE